jgi:hypothetical protein
LHDHFQKGDIAGFWFLFFDKGEIAGFWFLVSGFWFLVSGFWVSGFLGFWVGS